MNKTKRVAWHKHLKGEKKYEEKMRQAKKSGAASSSATSTPARTR